MSMNELAQTPDMFALAEQLAAVKDIKKDLTAQQKENQAIIDELEEKLSLIMIEDEIQRFDKNGKLFYLSITRRASVDPETREELLEWLREHGAGGMITVNAQSLTAYVNEHIDQLEEMQMDPELIDLDFEKKTVELVELVKTYEKVGVNVKKSPAPKKRSTTVAKIGKAGDIDGPI